jgi:hypothetical protein
LVAILSFLAFVPFERRAAQSLSIKIMGNVYDLSPEN